MPWMKDDITRLIEVEAQLQNVDPRLALAVAEQESRFDPAARSPKGATGIFQLMPGTARDLKVNPANVAENIEGGIRYLSQMSQRYGGDTALTLAAYKAGPGTVDAYKGTVPPFKETRGYVSRILRKLGPSSAEAATPQPAGRSRLEEIEAELARRDATQPPPPASQTPPPVQASRDASQGPPASRLSLGDPAEAATEPEARATIEQMRARQLAPLAVGGGTGAAPHPVTDPIALLAIGGRPQAPSTNPDPQARVREELAAWEQQAGRPWREGDPRLPSEKRLGAPDEAPLEEGMTKPSTMIPLLMPGAGAHAGIRLVPEAWRWVGRIGGEAATQTAAELGGRVLETGKTPDWKEIAATTAWNLAPQAIEEGTRATFRTILRSGQGARTILSDVAAQESKGLGRRVFHPQDEQVLSKMFEDVKASGVKLDIDPVTDLFTSLTPAQRQVLLRDVKAISSPLAGALQRTGQPGAFRLTGWDIGDLQTLRSALIKRSQSIRAPERVDLMSEMRMAVDDAIERGMAVGSTAAGGHPETLQAAQAGWRRLRQSDDLQALVTKHTNYNPNTAYQDFNLAAFTKSLDGTNPLGRKVAASFGDAERRALQQELTELKKRYPFVKVPNTVMNFGGRAGLPYAGYQLLQGNVGGAAVAASSAVVALALQSPKAMSYFRSAIVNGKGRLSSNDLAAIVNAVRQVSDVEEPTATGQ